jgi:hypothetical protein
MTTTVVQGYGSRLVDSLKGVVVGLFLFVVSFPLLWWNEGRAVQTAKSLEEGASMVVPVAAFDRGNDGKLVHFTGQAATSEKLSDDLGASMVALRFQRSVEMYQWEEHSSSHEDGRGNKITTYTYSRDWSNRLISSSVFKEDGHENPEEFAVAPTEQVAEKAKLGGFDLSPSIIREHVDKWEPADVAVPLQAAAVRRLGVKRSGDYWYVGDDPKAPSVGDCRFTYRAVVVPLTMSIIAKQQGSGFAAYPTKAGDDILLTAMEAKDAPAMFTQAQADNVVMTWFLRFLGWLFMTLGVFLVLRPIAMGVNFVPFAGSLVSSGAFLVGATLASGLSLLTISVAWLVARPLLGIALLVPAVATIAATTMSARKRMRAHRESGAGSAPANPQARGQGYGAAGYPPANPQAWGQGYGALGYSPANPQAGTQGYGAPGYPAANPQAWGQGYGAAGYPPAAAPQGAPFGHYGPSGGPSAVNGWGASSVVGRRAMVRWTDGQQYPGTILHVAEGQSCVGFPDGRQVWVPNQHVTPS